MTADVLDTAIGPADVFHRLALGVVLRDGLTSRPATGPGLRVGRQAHRRLLGRRPRPDWPCLDLERLGEGRFRLRHGPTVPTEVVLRLDDGSRRYVPRRLRIAPWPLSAAADPDPAHYVPVASRTLHAWLAPGAAYPCPRGATAVRGRVEHGGVPVRWVRVTARTPGGALLGRAHGDDRGEFLLVLTTANQNPLGSTVTVDLFVDGPADPVPPDGVSEDPLLDLPVEPVPRAGVPPQPADLDGPLLRGATVPAGHVPSTAVTPQHVIDVGAELVLDVPIEFDP